MAQISSLGALPDPSSRIPATSSKPGVITGRGSALAKSTGTTIADQTQPSPLQAQLSRLSAVLNGLQNNASINRAQFVQTLSKVKSGTYEVNPNDVSKSMINDLLSNN